MREIGVVYLIQDTKHWNVLCASILSLRDHWKGDICVMSADESGADIAERLAGSELGVIHKPLEGGVKGDRNSGYANKPRVMLQSPFNATVFIDADTIIAGDITDMFPSHDGKLKFTEFCGWTTQEKRMRGRLKPWESVARREVGLSLCVPYHAINTGVFGFDHMGMDFAEAWLEMTHRQIGPICDEIAMQLLLPDWEPRIDIMSDIYNKSLMHGTEDSDTRIFHFHSKKHVKNEKTQTIWVPIYNRCLEMNLANIREWSPGDDRRLALYLENQNA